MARIWSQACLLVVATMMSQYPSCTSAAVTEQNMRTSNTSVQSHSWFLRGSRRNDRSRRMVGTITTTECKRIRSTDSFQARLDLMYLYKIELENGDAPDLDGIHRAVATSLAHALDRCNEEERPAYAVQLSATQQHQPSYDTCEPTSVNNTCLVIRDLTSILMDEGADDIASVAFTVIGLVLGDVNRLNQFTWTHLVSSELVERTGQQVILLNNDTLQESNGENETAGVSFSFFMALLAASLAFLATSMCLYLGFRYRHILDSICCERKRRMDLSYWQSKRRRYWAELENEPYDNVFMTSQLSAEDRRVVSQMIAAMPAIDQINTANHHSKAISDLTSDSMSIISSLKMDSIKEESPIDMSYDEELVMAELEMAELAIAEAIHSSSSSSPDGNGYYPSHSSSATSSPEENTTNPDKSEDMIEFPAFPEYDITGSIPEETASCSQSSETFVDKALLPTPLPDQETLDPEAETPLRSNKMNSCDDALGDAYLADVSHEMEDELGSDEEDLFATVDEQLLMPHLTKVTNGELESEVMVRDNCSIDNVELEEDGIHSDHNQKVDVGEFENEVKVRDNGSIDNVELEEDGIHSDHNEKVDVQGNKEEPDAAHAEETTVRESIDPIPCDVQLEEVLSETGSNGESLFPPSPVQELELQNVSQLESRFHELFENPEFSKTIESPTSYAFHSGKTLDEGTRTENSAVVSDDESDESVSAMTDGDSSGFSGDGGETGPLDIAEEDEFHRRMLESSPIANVCDDENRILRDVTLNTSSNSNTSPNSNSGPPNQTHLTDPKEDDMAPSKEIVTCSTPDIFTPLKDEKENGSNFWQAGAKDPLPVSPIIPSSPGGEHVLAAIVMNASIGADRAAGIERSSTTDNTEAQQDVRVAVKVDSELDPQEDKGRDTLADFLPNNLKSPEMTTSKPHVTKIPAGMEDLTSPYGVKFLESSPEEKNEAIKNKSVHPSGPVVGLSSSPDNLQFSEDSSVDGIDTQIYRKRSGSLQDLRLLGPVVTDSTSEDASLSGGETSDDASSRQPGTEKLAHQSGAIQRRRREKETDDDDDDEGLTIGLPLGYQIGNDNDGSRKFITATNNNNPMDCSILSDITAHNNNNTDSETSFSSGTAITGPEMSV